MSGRDCLWEISGAPHCWLSLAAEEHGLSSFPVNLRNGFDIYHKDTWARLRDLRRERKPLKLWFSLPFTKWCSWTSVNYNNPEGQEKLATARRKERRLLWEVNQFIKEAMYEDPAIQIYFEWPWPNNGWKQRPMEDLQEHMADQGTPWLSCRVDGCNYGLRTEDGNQFIKRPWLIRTTDECFHRVFRAKVCPGNHGIHADVSKVTAASSFYPWRLVQAIARHWRDQLAPARHHRLLLQREEIPQRAGGDDLEDADHLGYLPTEHLAVEDEVEEEHDLLTMKEDERLIVEHMAREARLRQDFSMDTCQVIMMELAHRLGCASSRHGRWPQGSPLHVVFGGYSHGKFGGLTTSTTKFPEVVKFLNLYLMHYNPRGQWSSLMVTFNGRALPHRDHHNMKNTTNLLHCLGNFEGGGLWIQSMDSEVSTSDTRRKLPDGIMALGKVADANRKFVTFRPEVFHATQPWTGYRVAISAYTTRLLFDMDSEARQRLRDLGLPMLSKAPVGAPDLLPAQVEEVELEGVDPRELRDWEAQVAKFHKAAGHPTNRNLARIVKDAGHPGWKVEVALRHQCPACLSLKPGGTSSGQVPPASTQTMYAAWEAVGVDSGEWVPPGSRTKVKFLLFMDLATKLRVICPLFTYNFLEMRAESGGDLIRSFSERWLGVFPKPKILVLDAAKSFVSDAVHEFASSVNILLSYVAEKEAWAHGTVEAGVQDVKMTASAIYLDAMDQDPYVTLHLATSALNSTEYTAGFSSFQWAYGKEYSLTDEDVRTYTAANFKDEFSKLMALREKAEATARHTRAKRVLSKLGNTIVRQPLRQYQPLDLVKVWRKVWPSTQHHGPRGGLKKSGRPHWIGPGRVVFSEVLPHQEQGDDRRHIVWVLVGSQLFRCSIHSVRPVTETERFQFETSGEERPDKWKSLSDVLPKREYFDLADHAPAEDEVETPDLPRQPDASTMAPPTRRVSRKTRFAPEGATETAAPTEPDPSSSSSPTTTAVQDAAPSPSSSTAPNPALVRQSEEDVNDYDDTEIKRPRLDENWVELLKAEATQESKFDLFHAMEATEEFMKIEFDLDVPKSNRQKKMLLHNPTAYLVRKMKDAEVVLSKLSPGERELFRRAKAKEVESFIKNEAVRRCTDDAEIRRAYETRRIVRAEPVLGERCLWVWKSATEQDGPHAKAIGVMGGHVDDFHRIGDDSPEWLSIKESVNKAYKWGTAKVRSYRHAGTDVVTVPDELGHDSIEVNQDYYTEAIPDIDIDPDRLRMDGDMNHKEINACRGSLGALQWAATQSQPLVCARCSLLTSELATNPTMEVAREIQALIGELRAQPTKLVFRKFPDAKDWRDIVFISMGDQAHNNRPKGDSTGGLLTLMAGPSCVDGRVCPMSLLAWRTWKLKRKAISSNDAEVQAMLEAEDSNFRTRLLWSGLHGAGQGDSGLSLRRDLVQHVEQQVVNIKGIMCTDSKGGFDAIEVNESPLLGLSNTRAALQAYQLRGNLRRAAGDLHWVASDYDLADALTKKRPDCRVGLTRFLQTGVWCIKYDPQFQSAKKNKKAGRTAVGEIDDYLGRDPSSSWLSVLERGAPLLVFRRAPLSHSGPSPALAGKRQSPELLDCLCAVEGSCCVTPKPNTCRCTTRCIGSGAVDPGALARNLLKETICAHLVSLAALAIFFRHWSQLLTILLFYLDCVDLLFWQFLRFSISLQFFVRTDFVKMADNADRSQVPSWDGSARTWRRYTREVAWWVTSTPSHKRRYCASKLLSRLSGPARLLAMSWSRLSFDSENGTKVLLQRLAASPLVRRTLPNAAAICQQYFSFRRNPSESIGNFLVRETLVHEEFVEAIIRLHEEKVGISQEARDFGLPAESDGDWGEWNDASWTAGGWDWWNDDGYDGEAADLPDGDSPEHRSPGEGAEGQAGAEPPVAAPGSSPSHRGDGDAPLPREPAEAALQADQAEVPREAVDEMSVADSFILGVLRGWRLLQAAGLSAEEKRDILSSTKNSLDYEVVAAALQSLWDDQLLGHRNHSGHGSYSLNYATQADDSYDAYPITSGWEDEWWPEGMYGEHYEDAWDEQLGWWEDEWSGHEGLQATTTAEDLSAEDQERLREAQQAERVAENLAAEAQRTWTEAQRATQQLRRDRGFGAVTSSSKGACFECGGPHLARDCPHRRSGFKGKGKSKGGYQATMDDPSLYYQFKGKGKGKSKKGYWSEAQAAWTKGKQKGKGKGKDPLRTVNAYSNEYFIGGLELRDRFDLNSTSMASSSPSTAMLDSGATASAAPEAVVQSLVTAVLAQDRQARIELDQASRPYFRFGNGKWGRALCRVTIQSRASGHLRSFALYTLPNPAEYYQAQFDKSTLVPILIGMDFIGPEGVGMLIDFATGLAMFTKESSPEIFQLNVNSKGHYTLDLVQYLTRGHKVVDGHAHVLARDDHQSTISSMSHQMLELWTVWIDLQVSDQHLHERDLSAADPEVEAILAASTKASAKPKNRARSLDKTRIMKMDPRDPRANPRQWPCYGQHEPGAPQSNMHGQWIHCQHCDLRLLYTPRKGSPSNTTAVVNAAMVTRMLKGLQPMLGNTKPTAKICHHMMAKITAEEVMQKAVTQLLATEGYPSQPPTTSATPTSSTWGMVNDDYDQELIQAYEEENDKQM
ncbi:hypothetical protein AK812_SmicGene10384 [Symbiodinium microadriaticum]|uniref:Integrase catalytic domain-containing protein n=1 Tax=Symbiodinium microadriaticum TaxID=2951 RepID=A0A1Q9EFX8_SYMMI|nr:hypothetical protein AK812_SmicGene10384 [Symbiodinium microadriaticum]